MNRMITEQEFNTLLQKYRNGQCTEAELGLIDSYMESRHKQSAEAIDDKLVERTFDRITNAIATRANDKLRRKSTISATLRVAATLLIFFSAAGVLYLGKDNVNNLMHPVNYTNVVAGKGRNLTVSLPDGSVVVLNQNSQLSYSNRYNEQLREVSLVGEAFFEVAKDKTRPFVVHTGRLSTKVLGTSFNIEAYPSDHRIEVALITGKIWLQVNSISGQKASVILKPNQAFSYDKLTGKAEKRNVNNAENYAAWKEGKIKFTNTTLAEALSRLNITFSSKIRLSDPHLGQQRIYGEFGINESVDRVVANLCLLTKAKYLTKPDGEIIIYPFNDKNKVLTKTEPMK